MVMNLMNDLKFLSEKPQTFFQYLPELTLKGRINIYSIPVKKLNGSIHKLKFLENINLMTSIAFFQLFNGETNPAVPHTSSEQTNSWNAVQFALFLKPS